MRNLLMHIWFVFGITGICFFQFPLYAKPTYLECKETFGVLFKSSNGYFIKKGKGLENWRKEEPPQQLPENKLVTHKVMINSQYGTGSWKDDYQPNFYPTHISFSISEKRGRSRVSDILKIRREPVSKRSKKVSFERIYYGSSTTDNSLPYKTTNHWRNEIVGECTVIKQSKKNLF